jgi:hypothetical protein
MNHQYYELPTTLKSNRISFGKGERRKPSLENGSNKTPDPTAYEITSDFNKTAKANQGKMFSFGASREAYSRVYCEGRVPHDRDIPGPGTYGIPQRPK